MKHLLLLELNSVCDIESAETRIDILVKNFLNLINKDFSFSGGNFILGTEKQLRELLDRNVYIEDAIAEFEKRGIKTPKQLLALIMNAQGAHKDSELLKKLKIVLTAQLSKDEEARISEILTIKQILIEILNGKNI